MPKARTIRRQKVTRTIRATKSLNASAAIGDLCPGMELFILTYGQFSLIDAIAALVQKTGPADVTLSTWTAGHTDLTTCANLLVDAKIRSFRMVVDRSFLTRQPGYCQRMLDLFGQDCIRTWSAHAKFAVIRNDEWKLAVRTSMNLNTNPRLENLEVSDDPMLCDFLTEIVDELFAEQSAGVMNADLPSLAGVTFADLPPIRAGRATANPTPHTTTRI